MAGEVIAPCGEAASVGLLGGCDVPVTLLSTCVNAHRSPSLSASTCKHWGNSEEQVTVESLSLSHRSTPIAT